jgi:hypothetical protein
MAKRYEHKMDVGEDGIVCSWPGGAHTIPWNQCLMSDGTAPKGLDELTQDQRYHIASDMIKDGSNSKLFRYLFKRAWPSPNPVDYTGSLNKDFLDMSKNNSLEVHADNLTTIEWNASGPASTVPPHIVGVTRDCGISSNTIAPWAFSITSFATAFDTATKSGGKVWPPRGETIILTERLFTAFGYPDGMSLKATTVSNEVWTFELTMFGRTFKGKTDNESPDFVELKNFTQGNDKNKQWFKQNPFKVTSDGRIDRQPGQFQLFEKVSKTFKDYTEYETNALLIIILKSLGDRLQCLFHLLNWVEHKQGPQTTVLMNTCDGPVFTVSLQFGPNTALLYDKYTNKGDKNRYHRCLLLDRVVNPCETCRKKNIIKISDCIDSNRSLIRLYTTIYRNIKKYYETVSSEKYVFRFETNGDLPKVTNHFFVVILRQLMVCNYKLMEFMSFLKQQNVIVMATEADNTENGLTSAERTQIHTIYNERLNTSTNEFIKDYGYISFFTETSINDSVMTKLRISNNNKLTMGSIGDTLMFELYNELGTIPPRRSPTLKQDYKRITISQMMMDHSIIIPLTLNITTQEIVWTISRNTDDATERQRRSLKRGVLLAAPSETSPSKGGMLPQYVAPGEAFQSYITAKNFNDVTTTSLRNIIPLKDILLESIQIKYKLDDKTINDIKAGGTVETSVDRGIYIGIKEEFMTRLIEIQQTFHVNFQPANFKSLEDVKGNEIDNLRENINELNLEIDKEIMYIDKLMKQTQAISTLLDNPDVEVNSRYTQMDMVVEDFNAKHFEVLRHIEQIRNVIDTLQSITENDKEYNDIFDSSKFAKLNDSIKYFNDVKTQMYNSDSVAALSEDEPTSAAVGVELVDEEATTEDEPTSAAAVGVDEGTIRELNLELAEEVDMENRTDILMDSPDKNVINNLLPDIDPSNIDSIKSVYNDIYTKLYSRLNICISFNLKKILITNLYDYIVWYRDIEPSSILDISHPIFDLITDLTSITEKLSSIGIVPPIYNEYNLADTLADLGNAESLISICQESTSYGFNKEENIFLQYMRQHVLPIVDTSIFLIPLKSQDRIDKVIQHIITNMNLKRVTQPEDTGGAEDVTQSTDIYKLKDDNGIFQDITHKDIENEVYTVIKRNIGLSDKDIADMIKPNNLTRTYSATTVADFPDVSGGRSGKMHKRKKYTKRGKMYKRKKYTKRGKMHKRKYTKRGKMHKRKYTKR